MTCTEQCWTPVPCPDHGHAMTPFGRLPTLWDFCCCDNYIFSTLNPRHLWDEHDSARYYTDPEGWAAHEADCEHCKGDTE